MSTAEEKEKPTKTLTWRGSSQGLGDRILGLATVLVVAEESNRDLAMVWKKNPCCFADFHDLFDMNVRLIEENEVSNFDITHPGFRSRKVFEEAQRKNILSCTKEYFEERISKNIKAIEFNNSIYTETERISEKWDLSEAIGLHLRETEIDGFQNRCKRWAHTNPLNTFKRFGYSTFFSILFDSPKMIKRKRLVRIAARECKKHHVNKIFIASDSKDGLEYLKKKLIQKKLEVYHLQDAHTQNNVGSLEWDMKRQTSVQLAAIDLFLLSRCEKILASVPFSSFVKVSSTLNNDSEVMFVF